MAVSSMAAQGTMSTTLTMGSTSTMGALAPEDARRTVTCILCRGTVNFKNNDPAVFRSHMKEQHGAFHMIDYILASCFLPHDQLTRVAASMPARQEEGEEMLREKEVREVEVREVEVKGEGASKREAVEVQGGTPKKRKIRGEGEFKCQSCEKRYTTKHNMKVHMMRAHGVNIKKELEETAEEDSTMDESLASNESENGTYDEASMAESMLQLDNALLGEEGAKNMACDLCDKKFVNGQGLQTHKTRMHGGAAQPTEFPCQYGECGKVFSKKNQLRTHEVTGHGRVPRGRGGRKSAKQPQGSVFHHSSAEEGEGEVDAMARYLDVPAESDLSMDLADIAAMEGEVMEDEVMEDKVVEQELAELAEADNEEKSTNVATVEEEAPAVEDNDVEVNGADTEDVATEKDMDETETEDVAEEEKVVAVNDETEAKDEVKEEVSAKTRLPCAFECGKSFTMKSNLAQHEIKIHNRPLKKNRRKSTSQPQVADDGQATDGEVRTEGSVAEVEASSSFLTDTSLGDFESAEEGEAGATCGDAEVEVEEAGEAQEGKEEVETEEEGDREDLLYWHNSSKEEKEEGSGEGGSQKAGVLNLKSSEYFTKYPKAIANPQERSLKLFVGAAEGLPEGWRVRELQDPRDETRRVRHYLSPDTRVLKTGQGVVEYLRLEGLLHTDQILDIAKTVLLLSDKKIKALYL